jgi:pilus assembly protein CpaE
MSTAALLQRKPAATEELPREPFGAYLHDDSSRAAVLEFAGQRGWPADEVARGGLPGALRTLSAGPPPRLLLIDLDPALDLEDAVEGVAELARAGTRPVVIGERNDVGFWRRLREVGAADYLLKPIDCAMLNGAFARLENPDGAAVALGRAVAVVGLRGGVGASLVAGNCAWIMAKSLRRKTYLVDLDVHFGVQALMLDVAPGPALGEALIAPDRVDAVFLEHAATPLGPQLHLLATEEGFDAERAGEARQAGAFLERARLNCDVALLDLDRHELVRQQSLLPMLGALVLVLDPSLAALRDACRLLRFMRLRHAGVRTIVVLNHRDPKAEVTRKEIEKGLEAKVDVELPYARDALLRCALAGEPLAKAAPGHVIARELARLTVQLAGVREAPKRAAGWRRRLLRR